MFNKDQAQGILKEIRESVKRDVIPVLNAYRNQENWIDKNAPGFWTIPRMIFPEIDGLARLRYGRIINSGSSADAVKFIRGYFTKSEYKQIGGFIYNVYRHGLLHSHFPKEMIICGKNRGWGVVIGINSEQKTRHLQFSLPSKKEILTFDGEEFFNDFLSAIDKYINDFNDPNKEAELIASFNRAYCIMKSPQLEQESRNMPFMQDSDYDFFK